MRRKHAAPSDDDNCISSIALWPYPLARMPVGGPLRCCRRNADRHGDIKLSPSCHRIAEILSSDNDPSGGYVVLPTAGAA